MKLVILLILTFTIYSVAQQTNFNIKGLNKISIELRDPQNILEEDTEQKILTETKLKLNSAGLDAKGNCEECPKLIISVSNLLGKAASVWLRLEEKIDLKRGKEKIATNAITYSDIEYVDITWSFDKPVYDFIMDKSLNTFIEEFFADSNKK